MRESWGGDRINPENATTREPSPCRLGEGCQHPRRPNSRYGVGDRSGGVSEGGMTGKDSGVSRETSNGIWLLGQPQTPSSNATEPQEAGRANGGVRDIHSSVDPRDRTTREERRDGTCPDADRSKEEPEDDGTMPIVTSEKVRQPSEARQTARHELPRRGERSESIAEDALSEGQRRPQMASLEPKPLGRG